MPRVRLRVEAVLVEDTRHLLGVVVEGQRHGHHHDLPRGEPQGPLATKVLRQDGHHALHRPKHRAVHDHRALHAVVARLVLQLEPQRQLEVELHGGALVLAAQRVEHLNVDLGPVEGSVAPVDAPLALAAELVQRVRHVSLGHAPQLNVAQRLAGPGGQLHVVRHAQPAVGGADEVEHAQHLVPDLVQPAEDVRVVLLEPPHAGEARQRAVRLVAVQHPKVGHADGQLAVAAQPVAEHEAVAGAVHGLEPKLLLVHLQQEHVVAVVVRVPRRLPQVEVEHVGSDHLLVAADPVLVADEAHQLVVDARTRRLEEGAPRRQLVEEEELLPLAHHAVVALLHLLLHLEPVLEVLGVGEGHTVHALQVVVLGVAQPVGGGVLVDVERPDHARGRQVRPSAQVHQRPAAVGGGLAAVRDLVGDELHLERVVPEQLQRLLLGQHHALEGLVLADHLLRQRADLGQRRLVEHHAARVRVVVEALLEGRPDAQVDSERALHGLAQHVRGRVPERHAAIGIVKLEKPDVARVLQWPAHVPQDAIIRSALVQDLAPVQRPRVLRASLLVLLVAVHEPLRLVAVQVLDLGHHAHLGQLLGNALRDRQRRRLPGHTVHLLAVRQHHLDRLTRLLGQLLALFSRQLVQQCQAVVLKLGLLRRREVTADQTTTLDPGARLLVRALLGTPRTRAGAGFRACSSGEVGQTGTERLKRLQLLVLAVSQHLRPSVRGEVGEPLQERMAGPRDAHQVDGVHSGRKLRRRVCVEHLPRDAVVQVGQLDHLEVPLDAVIVLHVDHGAH
mmetsp:Transcript_2393/g.7077  ORF Transcript_2393/g.7077 Transcript_2393/m.7077 type:complete len:787 (+) Transcript_2393:404-2764(+)